MYKLYEWIDRLWQWIAERVFVRFEFDLPVEELRRTMAEGRLTLTLSQGGFTEWLILSSWCRSEGLGAILVANRKRILLFSKPKYFFQVVFLRRSFSDIFLSEEVGPRLIFVPASERKRPFDPTPVEKLLSDLYAASAGSKFPLLPVFILWRKHMRGHGRTLSEYFLGLSSNPNILGKIWYLVRKRRDSSVRALTPIVMSPKETLEYDDAFDDTEAMHVAKNTRRKILVLYNKEMRVVLGPRYSSPISVKETLMRDPELLRVIEEVAAKEGVDKRKVMSRAYQNLTEIVSNYHFRFIEVMYVFLTWLFTKVFDGLETDDKDLQEVRELMKVKPVVFVPCHRSHLDYLVIPYVMFIHDMVTPHTAAGLNMAFWPTGNLLRMGGAFFIRRSFRGDAVYTACLRKYVQFLVVNRYNALFFIEGTRSRSGKMLAPAYGMLKMVMETYQQKACDDIALIPVSLCYDEVPEQSSYQKELTGGTKVKESAKALIKSRKIVKRNIGKVYVKFAPPLLVKDIYASAEATGTDSVLMLQKTAFQLCKSINDVTPVTPKSLVSSVLLGHPLSAISLEEILRLSTNLLSFVRWSNSPLSVSQEDDFKRAVEQTIKRLVKSNVIQVSDSVPRAYFCEDRKRVLLNFYKNNAIHCLVSPSVSLLAFFSVLKSDGIIAPADFHEKVAASALTLRNLLKFEFFFSPTNAFLEEHNRNLTFFTGDAQWRDKLIPQLLEKMEAKFRSWNEISLYMRLLGELLQSYLTALQFMKDPSAASGDTAEKKMFLQRVFKFAETKTAHGGIAFPESMSIQNYSNALLLFENMKLLSLVKEPDKTTIQFQRWDDRMASLSHTFAQYLDLMQANPEGFVHPESRWLIRPT